MDTDHPVPALVLRTRSDGFDAELTCHMDGLGGGGTGGTFFISISFYSLSNTVSTALDSIRVSAALALHTCESSIAVEGGASVRYGVRIGMKEKTGCL